MDGGTGACSVNGCVPSGAYRSRQAARAGTPDPPLQSLVPGVSDGLAVGCALICTANCGTGRAFISAARTESRTKSCVTVDCRKRTSVFDGCTLTSTSPLGISKNRSTTGYTVGGRILRYA